VGFRQNLYGKFAVNVGVYVPELHAYGYTGGGKLAFIHEDDGWVRERLGILGPERQDLWWDLKAVHEQAAEVFRRIERDAYLSSQSSKHVMRFSTHGRRKARWKRIPISAGSPAAGRTLLVQLYRRFRERRREAKPLLRAALSYDPNHPSSARIRSLLEALELKE